MKRFLKRIRDNPAVLFLCVSGLRLARHMGVMRSPSIFTHVPFRGTVTVDCGNRRRFRIRSRGHKIENSLYWEGLFGHEPNSMRFWTTESSNARVVFDIGANSGVYALAAAACGAAQTHAFEPLERVHSILLENVALNPNLRIQTWACAIGETDGECLLFDPGGEAPSSASLSPDFATTNFEQTRSYGVRVLSIDSFCAKQEIESVDLIKIDVEGYEASVLRGMIGIVSSSWPTILIEVLPEQEAEVRRLVEDLWGGRYHWMRVDEGPGHASRNVILAPRKADVPSPVGVGR